MEVGLPSLAAPLAGGVCVREALLHRMRYPLMPHFTNVDWEKSWPAQ